MAILDPDNEDGQESPGKIAAEEFLREPGPDDAPRDPFWLRVAKFAALIVGPAVVCGVIFAVSDYFLQFSAKSQYEREKIQKRVETDSEKAFKVRLAVGAIFGGALGSIYVVRCIIKRVDP